MGYDDDGSRKKKLAILGVSSILLVAAVVGAVAYGLSGKDNNAEAPASAGGGRNGPDVTTSSKAVQALCQHTDYKETCEESLSKAKNSSDPKELVKVAFQATVDNLSQVIKDSSLLKDAAKDPRTSQALETCKYVLNTSIDDFQRCFDKVDNFDISKLDEYMADLKTWLSGAITLQETCLDAFENTTGDTGEKMKQLLKTAVELSSNGLAIVTDFSKIVGTLGIPGLSRRLLSKDEIIRKNDDDYDPTGPGSASHGHQGRRRLLEAETIRKNDDDYDLTGHGHQGGRRLLETETIRKNDDDYDPTGPGSASHGHQGGRRLLEAETIRKNDDDYDPSGPGSANHAGRRLFEVETIRKNDDDYDPSGPGSANHAGRRLFEAKTIKKIDDDYDPSGPGSANHAGRRLFQAETIRKNDDDYDPSGPGFASHGHHGGRRLLETDYWPGFVSKGGRRLLETDPASIKPNAVIAQDGSGTFKTIRDAINAVPKNNTTPFVILIKAGVYKDVIEIPRRVNNVVIMGEGPNVTKITGNKNFVDGIGTFHTATVAINGDECILRDIGIENSAGAEKHQAVALRVSGDKSIIYNCQIDGYQDTLYSHSYRQYYRDTTISGTIDFIFGDATAVFQNCKMVVRRPLDNQACMVTAQGRNNSRSTGAIVFQNCSIVADPAFLAVNPPLKAYLGRPWKEYSRTIIMQSNIDAFIAPEGWSPWMGTFGLNTLYYAEYQNRGLGANTSERVDWPGIQHINPEIAESFTPGKLYMGDSWITEKGFPYEAGMMKV
ncbi:hypothetical protein ACH5RR_033501 [Cinchona calisaya]|uniref:pectinesterase n=1 Tax=Cinchona calisaya TaxID=153742 RepID=A0ABD2YQ52_9GENT